MVTNKYFEQLHALRANPSGIDEVKGIIPRLRLATALYNDLRPEDKSFVRYLFTEELKTLRKLPGYDLTRLRLMGLMLTKFSDPEDIWLLFKAHTFDPRFDLRFVLAMGVFLVHFHLDTNRHRMKKKLRSLIGGSYVESKYTQDAINTWCKAEERSLEKYKFTPNNEIHTAALFGDRHVLRKLLPDWVARNKFLTKEKARQYVTYAIISGDEQMEIEACESYIKWFEEDTEFTWTYKKSLVSLYRSTGKHDEAIKIICDLLCGYPMRDRFRVHLVETLCDSLIASPGTANKQAVNLLKKMYKKYTSLLDPIRETINQVFDVYPSL